MKLQLDIPEQKIASLLCTAFEGGVGYWARIKRYITPENPYPYLEGSGGIDKNVVGYADFPLHADGAVYLEDIEDNNKLYKLNLKSIRKGIAVMIKDYPTHFGDFMADNADAITGDVFVQCCIFGDVKYG